VAALRDGIADAAAVARNAGMVRAFAIAPTANCAYAARDRRGFATAPEIAPPVARFVDRDSETFGVQRAHYPPDIEIAEEVGYAVFRQVADGIVRLMEETELFHGYSLNSWSDMVVYDESFLENWAESPQTSLYYSLQVRPDSQDKTSVAISLGEGYEDLGGFDDDEVEEEPASACSMEDPGFCSACAE